MKKPTRATRMRRAKKACHELWSKLVRRRDGYRCVLCGKEDTLQAHHWICHAAGSLGTRFLLDNGVTLCYACHIFKVHQRGDAFYLDQLKSYMIPAIITLEQYETIKAMGRRTVDFSVEDVEMIHEHLDGLYNRTGDQHGNQEEVRSEKPRHTGAVAQGPGAGGALE